MEKVVALASNDLISAFASNKKVNVAELSKEEQKKNKDFERIRKQLMKATLKELGIDQDTLDSYAEKLKAYEAQQNNPKQFMDILKDSENVLNGAKGTVKAGDKETVKQVATFGVGVATVASTQIAAVQAVLASISSTIPFVGVALSAASLGFYIKKRIKVRKGDKSDFSEKDRAFAEHLKEMEEKLKVFDNMISSDKEMILHKSNTMKKDEFKKFIVSYVQEKLTACGLINDVNVQAKGDMVSSAQASANIPSYDLNASQTAEAMANIPPNYGMSEEQVLNTNSTLANDGENQEIDKDLYDAYANQLQELNSNSQKDKNPELENPNKKLEGLKKQIEEEMDK